LLLLVKSPPTSLLGFSFRGTKIHWLEKAFREFKRRVKELTGRSWFVSMDYRYQKLAEYLRGWMNYFGKGPWHLSRTLATQTGMTNKWLKDQGLLSIKELWVRIHYPAMARYPIGQRYGLPMLTS